MINYLIIIKPEEIKGLIKELIGSESIYNERIEGKAFLIAKYEKPIILRNKSDSKLLSKIIFCFV